jgi:tRNA threonylcarbamoyl adenosine modification protein YeaZ
MILAIDTANEAASACLYDPQQPETAVVRSVPAGRGHDGLLLPLIEALMAPTGFSVVTRVAVTIGPGSFTGLRIGIAAAQAIGLACRCDVTGISSLSAFTVAALGQENNASRILSAVDARHGRVYACLYDGDGQALTHPALMSLREALALCGRHPAVLVGTGAPALAAEAHLSALPVQIIGSTLAPSIVDVARLGLLADPQTALPLPLYLKEVSVTMPPPPLSSAPAPLL